MTVFMVVFREVENGIEKWRETGKFNDGAKLETYFRGMQEKHPGAMSHLVNCTNPTEPPAEFQQSESLWWCPYCSHPRFFFLDQKLDVFKCNVCYITDRNFYVRKYNPRLPERRVASATTNDEE